MAGLHIDRLTPNIGAVLHGVDLHQPLDDALLERIYAALIEHLVIFFPAQEITPARHLEFARAFGELDAPHHVYPQVPGHPGLVLLRNDPDHPPNTDVWHSDLTFRPEPPFASILHALEVPATGGDTLWASMYAAYDALSEHLKSELAELSAVHAVGSYWNEYVARGGPDAVAEAMQATGAAVHPVVRHHAITQRPLLYVNRHFTVHVLGMSSGDSQRLLSYLFDHINQPDFQVRFRWQAKTLAMWDNRATQHYAVNDYLPARRCMHRATVIADRRCQ